MLTAASCLARWAKESNQKWSWQLTFIRLHRIRGSLGSSCALIPCKEREFGKSKIPECHRNVGFGSDFLQRDHSSRFPLSHQKMKWPSFQNPLRFFSWSKTSYCPFHAAEGKNFGHFIKMPKFGLGVIYSPSPGCHDWLSLLIIPSRSSGEVYTAIQLQHGVATLGVKGPLATLDCFMGESRNQDASVGEGGEK